MPSTGRGLKKTSASARRFRILRVAGQFFADIGYERTSMDRITIHAGTSKATLYAYFHGKDALFNAVMDHWLAECSAFLPEPREETSLRDRLTHAARELLRLDAQPAAAAISRALSRSLQAPSLERLKRWEHRYQPCRHYLESLLARDSQCDDPALAAYQFLLLIVGRLDSVTPLPVDAAFVEMTVDAFLRAYPEKACSAGDGALPGLERKDRAVSHAAPSAPGVLPRPQGA